MEKTGITSKLVSVVRNITQEYPSPKYIPKKNGNVKGTELALPGRLQEGVI
jgi:hypothetical protein